MKNVLIIYTGGTIGMTRTENGYAPQSGQFRRAMEAIPDLYAEQMPRWDMLEMDPLLDSSNMTVHEWNKIAQLVADHYDAYDGFVVLHGTDTMAYTASALSFMLEGLAKPVILTGSQIPMCEIRSDGRDNLITSLLIAGAEEVHEVCLYFGGKLLRGNRATKFSADRADRLPFTGLPEPRRRRHYHSLQRKRPPAEAERRFEAAITGEYSHRGAEGLPGHSVLAL